MGLFDGAKAAVAGNKAVQTHVAANKLAESGKPDEARVKYQEALKLYEESVRLDIRVARVLESYAVLLMREGKMEKASEILDRIESKVKLNEEEKFQHLLSRSICQWRTGHLDAAIATIKRAGAIKMRGTVYTTLGVFLLDKAAQTGDFTEAQALNDKAMDYDDEDGATLDNVAQLEEMIAEDAEAKGETEKAVEYRAKALEHYRAAHKIKPRQITTIYYLARMYHRAGEDDKARKVLSVKDTLYYTGVCPVTREMMDALAAEVG